MAAACSDRPRWHQPSTPSATRSTSANSCRASSSRARRAIGSARSSCSRQLRSAARATRTRAATGGASTAGTRRAAWAIWKLAARLSTVFRCRPSCRCASAARIGSARGSMPAMAWVARSAPLPRCPRFAATSPASQQRRRVVEALDLALGRPRLERTGPVGISLGIGAGIGRGHRGPHAGGDGELGVVRRPAAVGDLAGDPRRVAISVGPGREQLGDPAVERGSLARQQVVDDRLAQQRVARLEPLPGLVADGGEHLGVERLADPRPQPVGRQPRGGPEQALRRRSPDDGDVAGDLPGVRPQRSSRSRKPSRSVSGNASGSVSSRALATSSIANSGLPSDRSTIRSTSAGSASGPSMSRDIGAEVVRGERAQLAGARRARAGRSRPPTVGAGGGGGARRCGTWRAPGSARCAGCGPGRRAGRGSSRRPSGGPRSPAAVAPWAATP